MMFTKYLLNKKIDDAFETMTLTYWAPPLSAGRGWASNQIFKKGGLTGPQPLEGGCWERGAWLFSGEGVAIFT